MYLGNNPGSKCACLWRRSLTIVVGVFLLSALAFAQSNQGTVTGTLSDPTGAVIPNASIDVKNIGTGVVYRGGTSSSGNYLVSVPAGNYEITVNVTGFKKFVQQNVQVIVATDTRRDVTLEVGQATDVVTVNDSAPLLKTESGEMSHRVTTDEADNLPVLTLSGGGYTGATASGNIRNPLAVSSLLPGVSFANDNTMVVNGLPSNSEVVRIEGQDSTSTLWKVYQQNSQSSVDAIEEVSVQTSNFAAEYGQVGGGYFNFTMKSGTNQFHGSGYDYLVNEAFNAGLPFTDAGTQTPLKAGQHIRNPLRRNDYGFTIGGPIRIPKVYNGQNKSFFFFNFEQYRENRNVLNQLGTVPTADYRNGNFANAGCFTFSAATNTCTFSPALTNSGAPAVDSAGQALSYGEIFDPTTTRLVNGANVRTPFPNQVIPANRLDPVALKIQALMPLPNAPGLINNYNVPGYSTYQHTTNESFKLDQSISPTIKISGYFSRLETASPAANGYPLSIGGAAPGDDIAYTYRLNYDQTVRPTLLLHIGIGYFQNYEPTLPSNFDQSALGLKGFFAPNYFPAMGGLNNSNSGGYSPGVGAGIIAQIWEQKPTANMNLTWVKQNHTFKFGAEYIGEGYPQKNGWRSNGSFQFSTAETSDPWQNGQPLNYANASGFSYASFLLGLPDTLQTSPVTETRLGNHAIGAFAQDSWKVTRKLTLDYGLRYDFQTYLKEQYGRMADASLSTFNPTVGRLGAIAYEGYGGGRCNCQLSHNYPYAFGPRLGVAYQINNKTVLRAGTALTYGTVQSPAGVSFSVADYYSYNSLGYGITPVPNGLQGGNPYTSITWPNFDVGKYPTPTAGTLPPQTPFIFFDGDARPGRIFQWSIGVQREVLKDLVLEGTYVGNRGAWFQAAYLDTQSADILDPAILAAHGLNLNNAADRTLLTSVLSSPQAIQRGFGPSYTGMPLTQTVAQSLRPVPQWGPGGGPNPYLGPPVGKTWYDALQTKATKRFSHGLQMQGSFTWAKGLFDGSGTDTNFFVSGRPLINDIYNYDQNKQLNQLVKPLATVISGTYTTPKMRADGAGMRVVSQVLRDWQLGTVLRYQSGNLIQTPPSNNQLMSQLTRFTNADFLGSTQTFWNRVPGVNPLSVDPNCKCFNPQTAQVLNPAAWTDAAAGQFGVSAPFYSNYRWQRQPAEALSLGRNFRFGKEGQYNLQLRSEFQNIFNRHFLSAPSVGGQGGAFFQSASLVSPATQVASAGGVNTSGYGTIATLAGAGATPRSGQIVARFTF
jgi:hypothetical protein